MSSPSLVAVGTALPPHYVEQERLIAALRTLWAGKHHNAERIDQLHRAVRVSGRHLALPMEQYLELDTFQKQQRRVDPRGHRPGRGRRCTTRSPARA